MQLVLRADILRLIVGEFYATFARMVLHNLHQHRLLVTELLLLLFLRIR